MRKKGRKRKKSFLKFVLVILLFGVLLYFILFIVKKQTNGEVSRIKNYDYLLERRDTKLMEDNFNELNNILQAKTVDYEKYAEYLSKLFIIDLYTINNKDNRYDVGSVEYVYPEHKDNFILKVSDTLYKYVEEKSKRKQKLPEVANIELKSIENTTYDYNDNEYEAYQVVLTWDYIKDLGYDKTGEVTLMKIDDKLYVSEFIPKGLLS